MSKNENHFLSLLCKNKQLSLETNSIRNRPTDYSLILKLGIFMVEVEQSCPNSIAEYSLVDLFKHSISVIRYLNPLMVAETRNEILALYIGSIGNAICLYHKYLCENMYVLRQQYFETVFDNLKLEWLHLLQDFLNKFIIYEDHEISMIQTFSAIETISASLQLKPIEFLLAVISMLLPSVFDNRVFIDAMLSNGKTTMNSADVPRFIDYLTNTFSLNSDIGTICSLSRTLLEVKAKEVSSFDVLCPLNKLCSGRQTSNEGNCPSGSGSPQTQGSTHLVDENNVEKMSVDDDTCSDSFVEESKLLREANSSAS